MRLPRPSLMSALIAALSIGGCDAPPTEGPVQVSVIGTPEDLANPSRMLPAAPAKLMLESTAQGLVAFDAAGEIVPALAERWIVEDQGRSYIFRLHAARWPNGEPVRAAAVASLLRKRMEGYDRPDLSGDLGGIESVRAMTGEVIEIRLKSPSPNFLQILAQPQLGIIGRSGGTGPYRARRRAGAFALKLITDPAGEKPDAETETESEDAEESGDSGLDLRILRAERASAAIMRFARGDAALLLGGRFQHWPLLKQARVRDPALRIDPVQGLFGLAVVDSSPFLAQRGIREAIAMAIDRSALGTLIDSPSWTPINRLIPVQLDLPRPPVAPVWAGLDIADRRVQARAAVDRWRAADGQVPTLRIALPAGHGSRLLFAAVAADLRAVGIPAMRVRMEDDADLRLIDEVAPYDSAIWYLGRIGCARRIACDPAADAALQAAAISPDSATRSERLANAEVLATAHGGFIPLAAPLRWSLVAPWLDAFQPNARARHPLNRLIADTN